MELPEIVISAVLTVYIPIALKWMQSMQSTVAQLRTDVEVNSTKDDKMWEHVVKMEAKLDKVLEDMGSIREYMAEHKGKHS